jgi:hypothetical protein
MGVVMMSLKVSSDFRICAQCEAVFEPKKNNQLCCSAVCRYERRCRIDRLRAQVLKRRRAEGTP